MKQIFSAFQTFFGSLFTLWLVSSSDIMSNAYIIFNITDETTKNQIASITTTLIISLPIIIGSFLIRKVFKPIIIHVFYIQNDTLKNNILLKKEKKRDILCKQEQITTQFIVIDGCDLVLRIAQKLNARILICYNPNYFDTESKNGWDESDDGILGRNQEGCITLDLVGKTKTLEGLPFNYKYDFFIKPKNSMVEKSEMRLKIESSNCVFSWIVKLFVKVENNRLLINCEV